MTYNEELKQINDAIKVEKKDRKVYVQKLSRTNSKIVECSRDMIDFIDERIAKLEARRARVAHAATRGIFE